MIWRAIKVFWYLFHRLFIYGWLRVNGSPGLKAQFTNDFLNWSQYVLDTFQADVRISGREHIPIVAGRKVIILSNHQSQLDIPALAKAMGTLTGFVAKKELSRIPLLNFWMRQIGCVFIDRSDKRRAHLALEKAAREMGDKPLVVFPEGTRSKDGFLLPFKLGGTRLALLAQAIIVPVLIEGTRNVLENFKDTGTGEGSDTKVGAGAGKPGARKTGKIPVRLTIFPPLDTQGLDESKASQNKIKDYVEQCWRNPNAPI